MKFELLERYRKQSEESYAKQRERESKRDSALEEVQALKDEYAKVMRESLVSGVDSGESLDDLNDKIIAAERTYERKKRECDIAQTVLTPAITKEQVVAAWKQDFTPKYRSKVFDPAVAELLAAKLAYIEAYKKCRVVVRDFEDLKAETLEVLSPGHTWPKPYQYQLGGIDFNLTTETDTYYIKEADLNDLKWNKPVRSVQHVKQEGK